MLDQYLFVLNCYSLRKTAGIIIIIIINFVSKKSNQLRRTRLFKILLILQTIRPYLVIYFGQSCDIFNISGSPPSGEIKSVL